MPQDIALFDGTIAANIGFGKAGKLYLEIQNAARTADIHVFIVGLDHGYQTRVGERGGNGQHNLNHYAKFLRRERSTNST